eukprot:CAMPEP_0113548316 /NCGR_PEP_ID=MMETSP0015_2-20120614/12827_1 /TAXON_ID=2838 /ORGANISM="Odontella" /LENGTH=415 /DNA_ID=CAMNT_0000448935 /DNA_START=146 /DNA_END=1393 /DNA_ORIENTATION=- /assembly_acc=CAM_ASM_000160
MNPEMYRNCRQETATGGVEVSCQRQNQRIDAVVDDSLPDALTHLSIRSNNGIALEKDKHSSYHVSAGKLEDYALTTKSDSSVVQELRKELLAAQAAAAEARVEAEAKESLLARVTRERDENWSKTEKLRNQLRSVREQMNEENETLRSQNQRLKDENSEVMKEARCAREENQCVATDAMAMLSVIDSLRERIRVMEKTGHGRGQSSNATDDSCGYRAPSSAAMYASSPTSSRRHYQQEYGTPERHAPYSAEVDARLGALTNELRFERESRARREQEMEEAMHSLSRQVDFLASDNTSLVKKLQKSALSIAPSHLSKKHQKKHKSSESEGLENYCSSSLQCHQVPEENGTNMIYSRTASSGSLDISTSRRPSMITCFQKMKKAQSDHGLGSSQEAMGHRASFISHVSESDLAQYLR